MFMKFQKHRKSTTEMSYWTMLRRRRNAKNPDRFNTLLLLLRSSERQWLGDQIYEVWFVNAVPAHSLRCDWLKSFLTDLNLLATQWSVYDYEWGNELFLIHIWAHSLILPCLDAVLLDVGELTPLPLQSTRAIQRQRRTPHAAARKRLHLSLRHFGTIRRSVI